MTRLTPAISGLCLLALSVSAMAQSRSQVRGRVVDSGGKPISLYRIRLHAIDYDGTSRTNDFDWKEIADFGGEFTLELPGPGVFELVAISDGYALGSADLIDTENDVDHLTRLVLERGTALEGFVVDAENRPVDGATVRVLSLSRGPYMGRRDHFVSNERAIRTAAGKFRFEHLRVGPDLLRVSHPQFVATEVDVPVKDGQKQPVRIVMTKGASLRGQVFTSRGRPEKRIALRIRDSLFGDSRSLLPGDANSAFTDDFGRYHVANLPEGLCYVIANKSFSRKWGVIHRTIRLRDGQEHVMDLGGTHSVAGTVHVNGQPVAGRRLQLTGADPAFGIMKMFTSTDEQGRFTLRGPPPGRWTLYYDRGLVRDPWSPLRQIEIEPDDDVDLGLIEHHTGHLSIQCPSSDLRDQFLLRLFDPIRVRLRPVWKSQRRDDPSDPFVIRDVPPGDYELWGLRSRGPILRQRLQFSGQPHDQTIEVDFPIGNATLHGVLDSMVREKHLEYWSVDNRFWGTVSPDDAGQYEITHLPAGTYVIRQGVDRGRGEVATFEVAEGESKRLDLTADMLQPATDNIETANVRVFDPQGILMPCRVELKSGQIALQPFFHHNGASYFRGPPGRYTAVVQHSGYVASRKEFELGVDPARFELNLERAND